jgi:zinc transport system substrate-binding protein
MKNRSNFRSGFLCIVGAVVFLSWSIYVAECEASAKLTVYVVNYPLKYFAERIGGDHINVVFPAPRDVDPAYWSPDLTTISAFQKADLILLNGANYAKWLQKVSLPRSKLVNTSAKFRDRYLTADEITTHSHGAEGKHAHESLAFTTWLDPDLAARQAGAIAGAFARKNPGLKQTFRENYASLAKDLAALDRDIRSLAAKNPSQPLMVSHPVYDYFANRYKLNIKSVHWEPDEVPDASQWIELARMLKEHPARWMIWEGAPDPASVEKLKSMGVGSLVFDPCGNTPEQGDFLGIMNQNVDNLKVAFR